ncbi:hypothetical protein VE03_10786 [Pseudogymnoascus sp. 23342-1-I1]|nr:hypothetical protein VE03_10786 [Pseudogymnoascus sp. 23342-1-I1]
MPALGHPLKQPPLLVGTEFVTFVIQKRPTDLGLQRLVDGVVPIDAGNAPSPETTINFPNNSSRASPINPCTMLRNCDICTRVPGYNTLTRIHWIFPAVGVVYRNLNQTTHPDQFR